MAQSQTPLLSIERRGKITVASLDSVTMLDGTNVTNFGAEAIAYIQEHAGIQLLLNFEGVTYMSSAALTELLRINQALKDSGGSVRLCGLTENIRNVFQITNLEKLFFIHDGDDLDTAHKRFERSLGFAAQEDSWAQPDSKS